jgi:hypothetical protein
VFSLDTTAQNRLIRVLAQGLGIKHIDGKRALKGFTARNGCDPSDLIPDGSPTGEPEDGYKFRGHFLDLRTLAFALTDRGYSLASACEAFEVEHGKQHAEHNGEITSDYIDYNRRDVLATAELAEKLLAEFDKHPIDLQPTKAYSPASIGKSHLQAMGIRPILERQPDFPKKFLGYAQSAFFGGRTSAHIRKTAEPVVYTDFLSMYPTVNINMGLWEFVTAREITIDDHCEREITDFLNCVSADHLFNPDTWKNLAAFVQIIPDGDILPSRSKYATASNDWQVGVNHMYSDPENSTALWFALPDVVASVILTGRVPKIVDAFRLKAKGKSKGLKTISLRKVIKVDPRHQDLFKVVIEERKRLDFGTDMSKSEKGRLDKALKVLANSTSYGIYAEMNRQESDEKVNVLCHGIDPEPFTCKVKHPQIPGKYWFPPLAALITSAARLMLSLLEHCVSEKGGTYSEQVKPFNFLLTFHVKPFGHPKGVDPEHFHLIASYNNKPSRWLKLEPIDQYTGNSYRVTISGHTGSARTALVKTYGDVLREYEFHPESKCADATGNPCNKQTVGLLQRRHVRIDQIKYIGKESNHLEDVDAGLVYSDESIYTEYVDQSRDEWQTKILPVLKRLPLAHLISESGLSRRALLDIRGGRTRPHPTNQGRLTVIVLNCIPELSDQRRRLSIKIHCAVQR